MKTYLRYGEVFSLLILIVFQLVTSQEEQKNKVFLKNGNILVGIIVERIPDKAIVLKTANGNEIIDNSDILKIDKYNPKVISITPANGLPGSLVKIIGSDLGNSTQNSSVRFGTAPAIINSWDPDGITVIVPNVNSGSYEIIVTGNDYSLKSPVSFLVGGQTESGQPARRIQRKSNVPVQQQPSSEPDESSIGLFMIRFGYATPLKEFKETNTPDAGYAKNGFSAGWEGRAELSPNFYIPFTMDVSFLGLNTDELSKQTGATVTSEGGLHLVSWLTMGLGVAIPLSPTSYLFGSGDYGVSLSALPQIQVEYAGTTVTQGSATAFKNGYGFSFGITIAPLTFGYRTYFAKPKYTVSYTSSSRFVSIPDADVEQPTSVGIFYLGIGVN